MLIKNPVSLTKKEEEKLISDETISKSQKIKTLWLAGYSVKQCAEKLNIRYNFAYNVISNFVNVSDVEYVKPVKQKSKKDLIIEMFLQGKSNKEISIELKTNYNYVFNTIKQYKLENGIEEEAK